jgi:pyruvate/2-oxoglutarate dehydrogenase complex dihydrolipoamide dehydrogenase (E3) component
VLGAGQGGGPLAGALARAGRRTLLVERAHAGGTCVNEGCTPTKTMVASARVAEVVRRAPDFGVRVGDVAVDLTRVRARKRAIVDSFRGGSERGLADAGVEVGYGHGRFVAPRTLDVVAADGVRTRVTAPLVVISTGLRSARPTVRGLDDVPALDSTSIMELASVPEHLVVLGGGYVGLEFAQMFRRFGSRVTVLQRGPRLLAREDADVATALAGILREDGIDVRLDTDAARVAPGAAGGVRVTTTPRGGGHPAEVVGSHLLVATGRRPNSDALGADAGGVALDERGFVRVDARLATTAEGVYAIGDVKGGPAFTHVAYDDFRILRTNLLQGGDATTDGRLLPYAVFTDPQLGRVGMSEAEARAAGHDVRVATLPMAHVARALEVDEPRGFVKAVVDAPSARILGAAVLGAGAGELATALQLAMMGGLPYTALRDGVFAHPTYAESLNTLFSALDPAVR